VKYFVDSENVWAIWIARPFNSWWHTQTERKKTPIMHLTLTALIGSFFPDPSCKRNCLVKELAPLVPYFRVFVPQPHLTLYGA